MLCPEPEYQKCLAQHGDFIEWACGKCKMKRWEDLHPWTLHMLEIKDLQGAGYPFGKNDLTIEEWRSLGTINNIVLRINEAAARGNSGAPQETADGQ